MRQIMQGRITKVLNMKPQEILGLIEEAAGTRMFELKKQNAVKTIEKKETKLMEIDRVCNAAANPKCGPVLIDAGSRAGFRGGPHATSGKARHRACRVCRRSVERCVQRAVVSQPGGCSTGIWSSNAASRTWKA